MVKEQQPIFLVGSPVCTAWCSWQALNESRPECDQGLLRREKVRAAVHLDFVTMLYREQLMNGRYFVHEHPEAATSWSHPTINEILKDERVHRATCHQCQYGACVQYGARKGRPVKKATTFMSNAPEVLAQVSAKCGAHGGS